MDNTTPFNGSSEKEHKHRRFLLETAVYTLSVPLGSFLSAWICFALGAELGREEAIFSFLVGPLSIFMFLWRSQTNNVSALCPVLAFAICLLSALVVHPVYDTGWDSQNYHLPALLTIEAGWNPLFQPDLPASWKIQSFPKASWIIGAQIKTAFHTLTGFRAFHFSIAIASFMLVYVALACSGMRNALLRGLISALLLASPVFISQALTNYTDGALGVLILALTSTLIIHHKYPSAVTNLLTLIIVILAVNLKFSGFAFSMIFIAAFHFFSLLKKNKSWKNFACPWIGLVLGFLVFGYNPYVTNFNQHGSPFYPNADRILNEQRPANMEEANRIEKLFLSLFSEVRLDIEQPSAFRFPLSVSIKEVKRMGREDVRLSGFGPLFGLEFLAALLLAGMMAASRTIHFPLLAFAALLCFLSAVLFPDPWWARFIPQLWYFPLLLAATNLGSVGGKYGKLISKLILFLALTNSTITVCTSLAERLKWDNVWENNIERKGQGKKFYILDERSGGQAGVEGLARYSVYNVMGRRLSEQGLSFSLSAPSQCRDAPIRRFPRTYVKYCLR